MIHSVLRVVIKYVFGSCTFVEFVVPRVASCAFMWAERLLPFGEEKKHARVSVGACIFQMDANFIKYVQVVLHAFTLVVRCMVED